VTGFGSTEFDLTENGGATFDEILQSVDWSRMAEPQKDGYDTEMTLRLAEHGITPLRPFPYRRRAIDGAVTFCNGMVAVRRAPELGLMTDRIKPAELDHPNLAAGAAYLSRWPAAYAQFGRLVDTVYPYTDPEQAGLGEGSLGSSSHSYEEDFGSVHATVDNALGFAQALIHEMSHQKLRSLGVSFETAERLIVNDPSEQFESPIRKDRTRPMTAVFHAQYSFIHVTALDLHMLGGAQSERERQCILMLLARNVPRMQSGYEEVDRHIRTDDAGRLFVGAFMQWSTEILARGQAELDTNGFGVE
jgi:HEXXH motif-containing protein